MLQAKAKSEFFGFGAEGLASDCIATSLDEVQLVILQAVVERLPTAYRKTLLASASLAHHAPSAANKQHPFILASAAHCAVSNAVRIIQVGLALGCMPCHALYFSQRSTACGDTVMGVIVLPCPRVLKQALHRCASVHWN